MIKNEKIIIDELRSEDHYIRDKALRLIYKSMYPSIKNFILNNNGNYEDAADIFQDAIIVFYDKVRTLDFELNCTIKTYLYSVSKYMWLNKLKVNKRTVSFEEKLNEIEIMPIEVESLEISDQQSEVIKMIEKLGSKCKDVLTYYYFDRLKMKQIAVKMNFSNEQVAKNKKSSCLKKLKEMAFNSKKS